MKVKISLYCLRSVQMRTFFWSVFSRIQSEYGDLIHKSPYKVRIWENTDQKKLHIWTFFTQCCLNVLCVLYANGVVLVSLLLTMYIFQTLF